MCKGYNNRFCRRTKIWCFTTSYTSDNSWLGFDKKSNDTAHESYRWHVSIGHAFLPHPVMPCTASSNCARSSSVDIGKDCQNLCFNRTTVRRACKRGMCTMYVYRLIKKDARLIVLVIVCALVLHIHVDYWHSSDLKLIICCGSVPLLCQ